MRAPALRGPEGPDNFVFLCKWGDRLEFRVATPMTNPSECPEGGHRSQIGHPQIYGAMAVWLEGRLPGVEGSKPNRITLSPELLWGLLGGKRQVRWGVIMGWDRDWNRQFS